MKNKIKKIVAVCLSLAMCLSMGAVTFAATTVPSASDTSTITVENVESGAVVTAYQLVDAVYGNNGLTGYTIADGVSIDDIEAPTAEEITTIAKAINAGTLTLTSVSLTETTDEDGVSTGTYTGTVDAGMWIIVVTNAGSTIYNPMIVSAYYTDANDADSLTTGTVDADGNFVEGTDEDGNEITVYAKSTETSLDKVIETTDGDVYGISADFGDEVSFRIDAVIPDYSDAYDDDTVVFTITDTLSAGLDAVGADDITVEVNDTEVEAAETTYTVSVDGQVITIAFVDDYIIDNANAAVSVSYTTTLNENATLVESLDENTNTAVLTYTGEYTASSVASTDELTSTVYVYSFALTDELVKTSADGTATADGTTVTVTNALAGAEFTIYTDTDLTTVYTNDGNETGTTTSDENGYISFEGLEAGTYYVTETSAPEEYYINDTVYKVVISETYNADGTLATYTIAITEVDGEDSGESVYTLTYSEDGDVVSASVNPVVIINLTQSTLPSTGGIGLAVIIGVALIAGCAVALSFSRKKKIEE